VIISESSVFILNLRQSLTNRRPFGTAHVTTIGS
jgi:hypothetical protein